MGAWLILVVLVLVFAIAAMVWHFRRSNDMVQQWAHQNGFDLLRSERRFLRRGPYWWRTSKGQAVFYVTVQDTAGRQRSGWVRCGGWFLGLLSDQVDVEWDE